MLSFLLTIIAGWTTYLVVGAIYRLYFHPLSKFPGPKLAALTSWYEFYYDVVNPGQFIWQLEKLHEEYGPIVRITPEELHIKDSDFYDEIYTSVTKPRDKFGSWTIGAGAPGSTFGTVTHAHHRLRRSAINPFFSKRTVANAESLIREKVERLSQRFAAACETKEVLRLDAAYMALTMDIITHYAFGESYNYLDEDDFRLEWKETVIGGSASGALIRQFPWLFLVMKSAPMVIISKLAPQAALLVQWQKMVRRQIDNIIANDRAGKKAEGTIFQAILDSDLPEEEKGADRLQDEAQTVVGAGSETTAKTLSVITFYLLNDKKKLERLREELSTVSLQPGPGLWEQLERLPYLKAVIKEGLRHMHGVTTRLPRVAHEPIHYHGWEIPPNTPISESNYFVHMDPSIFPNPLEFNPERWIDAKERDFPLDRYLVSFTKGTRQCIGINLAYAELYLTLATIMRRFEFENYETTVEDVRIARDYFVGVPEPGSQGVRAIVTEVL